MRMSIGLLVTMGAIVLGTAAARGADGSLLEEIVVTAQKREQSVQDVPISLRVLSEKELGRLGADSMADFAGFVPALELVGQGPSRTQVTMRGVTTGDLRFDRPQIRETVGLYLDESPISTQVVSPDLGLLDIERIEVLRGPQGTLYGAGSLSGTVRMITRKPNTRDFELRGGLTVSDTHKGTTNYAGDVVLNVPLSADVAGLRFVGAYKDDGGYIDNRSTGRDNINDLKQASGRLALRVTPSERLTVDASVTAQDTDLGGDFSYRLEAGDLIELTPQREPASSDVFLPSVVVNYDAGPVVLTSVTSYFRKNSKFELNAGGFPPLLLGGPTEIDGAVITEFQQREWSQELRVTSAGDDRLQYTVGVFLQRQDNGFGQDLTYPGIDDALGAPGSDFQAKPDQVFNSDIELLTKQYALFGEATLDVTDALSLTLGGRAFRADQDSTVRFVGLLAVPRVGTTKFSTNEDGFNPKFNVTYRLTGDDLVYAQAAKGFRLGGTNEPVPDTLCADDLANLGFASAPESFESDSLWNYEIGAKTSWAGGRLLLNAAAYVIDWEKPPLAVDLLCGFSTIVNAGAFDINGAEFDLEARPIEGLTLRLGGAYNDGRLNGDLPPLGGVDGDRIPMSPRTTFNASVDYDFPLPAAGADASAFVHANFRYVDDRVTLFPANPSYVGYFDLPSYELVGLRAGLQWERWSVEAFADNVFDERPNLNQTLFYRAFDKIPGTAIVTSRPRTIGLRLAFTY